MKFRFFDEEQAMKADHGMHPQALPDSGMTH